MDTLWTSTEKPFLQLQKYIKEKSGKLRVSNKYNEWYNNYKKYFDLIKKLNLTILSQESFLEIDDIKKLLFYIFVEYTNLNDILELIKVNKKK